MMQLTDKLIDSVIKVAEEAGKAILGVYDGPIKVTVKEDESPIVRQTRRHITSSSMHCSI